MVYDVISVVVKGLDYKYQHSWTQALRTLAVFHRVAGGKCSSVMAPVLLPSYYLLVH